jgi:hypothetical protein
MRRVKLNVLLLKVSTNISYPIHLFSYTKLGVLFL